MILVLFFLIFLMYPLHVARALDSERFGFDIIIEFNMLTLLTVHTYHCDYICFSYVPIKSSWTGKHAVQAGRKAEYSFFFLLQSSTRSPNFVSTPLKNPPRDFIEDLQKLMFGLVYWRALANLCYLHEKLKFNQLLYK